MWTNLVGVMLSEVSQADTDRQTLHALTSIWKLKKSDLQKQRVELWLAGPGGWGTWDLSLTAYRLPVLS